MPDGTVFGSLSHYMTGRVSVVRDDPRNYAFSNIFAVAGSAKPYEKVAVAKNDIYVLEVLRAAGTSPWRLARHDEFALVMDGEIEFRFVKPDDQGSTPEVDGSVALDGRPQAQEVGEVKAKAGHLVLLPAGMACQIHAAGVGVILLQTIEGPDTVYRWAEICQTD